MACLGTTELASFRDRGFAVLHGVFDDADLAPVRDEYDAVVAARIEALVSTGQLSDPHREAPFDRRLALVARERPELAWGLDIMEVRGRACFDFIRHTKVLDLAEQFVGGEILCSPIQHTRATLPHAQTSYEPTPWHQDAATCWPDADPYQMLSIWIPLVDVTLDSGCLELMPGSHRLGVLPHTITAFGPRVADESLPRIEPVAVPLPAGGAVLFQNRVVHRARANRNDTVRWAMDLRYHDAYQPTGRPHQPAFLFRSRARPARIDADYDLWCRRWEFALAASASVDNYFRWR